MLFVASLGGTSLVALSKTDGGVNSLVIDNALRRLAGKYVGNTLKHLCVYCWDFSLWGRSHGSCCPGLFGESSAMVHVAQVCLGSLQPWFM